MLFSAALLSNRQIAADSASDLLIGGNYALTNDLCITKQEEFRFVRSFRFERARFLAVRKRLCLQSAETSKWKTRFYFRLGELAGILKAGSEILCSMPLPETASADQLLLFLFSTINGAVLSLSQGTANARRSPQATRCGATAL
jgi:hypothetical protein